MRSWKWRYVGGALLVAGICLGTGTVYAETSQSTHYQATETHFGQHSADGSCSGTYCSEVSIGSSGTTSPDSSYRASFKTVPSSEPSLNIIIDPGPSNLGILATDSTAYKVMTVHVRSELSGGYTLQMVGDPPSAGAHTLATPSSPADSQPGHEQFAINLMKNTSPSVGTDPDQVSAGSNGTGGAPAVHYGTANKFMYHSGDMIASSSEQSSETTYTVSMIVNISGATPPGHYSGDFQIIMMPGF